MMASSAQDAKHRAYSDAVAIILTSTISHYNLFIYEASKKSMEQIATHSQIMKNVGVSIVNVMAGPFLLHHVGLTYSIGKMQIPMSFGVVEAHLH